MGSVLEQHDENGRKEGVIYYLSKKFTYYKSRYAMIEKTFCALVWVATRLRQYMLYHTTWLISRMDQVKFIFERLYLSRRLEKSQIVLSEHDIIYMTKKSIKGIAITDHLADNPIEDYQPMKFEFLDEDILVVDKEEEKTKPYRWKMYFDGAVDVHGSGVGAVVISPKGKQFPVAIKLEFECTNNLAKYEVCVRGLKDALDLKVKSLDVFEDSTLNIYQVKGKWRTRDLKLIPYQRFLTELIEEFDDITFSHLTRDKNQYAYAFATLAVMTKLDIGVIIQQVEVNLENEPAHCLNVESKPNGQPWYYDILQYIKFREYPFGATNNNKKTISRWAAGFFLSGKVLYKRSYDGALLRCVDAVEANKTLSVVHDGICGTHANSHMMAQKS
ncbi:hypothetical protein L6164_008535 [Bauhinia variegata]|uniref:Uncharacterized protein n=1 Tax=Bauhinia variegata TaxID=167791 RepID=A0ACB9PGZ0_BAUVA|nr:hypothetical protein L6164_008535 [Bauhinia variegata]